MIDAGLGSCRDVLPSFPFGSDLTELEQTLLPTLAKIRSAAASPVQLGALAARGLAASRPSEMTDIRRRMGLSGKGVRSTFYELLIKSALAQE